MDDAFRQETVRELRSWHRRAELVALSFFAARSLQQPCVAAVSMPSANDPHAQEPAEVIGRFLCYTEEIDMRERFAGVAVTVAAPEQHSPEYLARFIARELDKWAGPIAASGASAD